MDKRKRKELAAAWKNRHPEIGVLSIRCNVTKDTFLFVSADIRVGFNRHLFQLNADMHPNKALQALWNQHGQSAFSCNVVKTLVYDDPLEDQAEKLEELLADCLAEDRLSRRL